MDGQQAQKMDEINKALDQLQEDKAEYQLGLYNLHSWVT